MIQLLTFAFAPVLIVALLMLGLLVSPSRDRAESLDVTLFPW